MPRLLALAVSLFSVSGCSLFGGEAEVLVSVRLAPPAADLTVEATVGGDLVDLAEQGGAYRSDVLSVSSTSTVVSCSVSSGRAATMGFVRLDLEDGWRYPVTCAVQEEDPSALCFGCRGSEAFVLDPGLGLPVAQRLWVVWAGDSIEDPPTY